jgi:hypothetical protein
LEKTRQVWLQSKKLIWAGHAAQIRMKVKANEKLIWKPKIKRPIRIPKLSKRKLRNVS